MRLIAEIVRVYELAQEHKTEKKRAQKRAAATANDPKCVDCGEALERKGKRGPLPTRCSMCEPIHEKELNTERQRRYRARQ